MADFSKSLPLPHWVLDILVNMLCLKCHAPLTRDSVTQIGLGKPKPEALRDEPLNDLPLGTFFYALTCRKCGQQTAVAVPTQGLMSVDRFAKECREGETRYKNQPPPTETTLHDLPSELAFRLTARPIKGPLRPSIRKDCPRKPINKQEVEQFKRRLRVVSFNRLSATFHRMMMMLDYDEPPTYEGY